MILSVEFEGRVNLVQLGSYRSHPQSALPRAGKQEEQYDAKYCWLHHSETKSTSDHRHLQVKSEYRRTPDDADTETTDEGGDTGDEFAEQSAADTNVPADVGELALESSEQVTWIPMSLSSPDVDVPTSHEDSTAEELPHELRRDPYDRAEHAASVEGRFAIMRNEQMVLALDQIRQEMTEDAELAANEREIVVSTMEEVAMACSAGLLAILLRGSSLAAIALSALPVWQRVDPLVILALSDEERKKREEELRAAREAEDLREETVGQLFDEDGSRDR